MDVAEMGEPNVARPVSALVHSLRIVVGWVGWPVDSSVILVLGYEARGWEFD